jgi:hypothetical protein
MNYIETSIHHLSPNQIKALFLLAKSDHGIISSTASGKNIGKVGKALGGVFSSLVRHNLHGEHFVIPWGKSIDGRGLRWKLNEKLISKNELLKVTTELLNDE